MCLALVVSSSRCIFAVEKYLQHPNATSLVKLTVINTMVARVPSQRYKLELGGRRKEDILARQGMNNISHKHTASHYNGSRPTHFGMEKETTGTPTSSIELYLSSDKD
eukprot:4231748-Amphidinium_carterae.1